MSDERAFGVGDRVPYLALLHAAAYIDPEPATVAAQFVTVHAELLAELLSEPLADWESLYVVDIGPHPLFVGGAGSMYKLMTTRAESYGPGTIVALITRGEIYPL